MPLSPSRSTSFFMNSWSFTDPLSAQQPRGSPLGRWLMHMKMWGLKAGISAAAGFEGARKGGHVVRLQQGLLERVGGDHGRDLLHAQHRPLELIGLAERRGGAFRQFVELALDVPKIALEVL